MLEVKHQDKIIFTSNDKWLHPLLQLNEFLKNSPIPPGELYLHDSVIGRAAALLIVRMGIKKCHGDLMSRKAQPILDENGLIHSHSELVDKIDCQTEELLGNETSPEKAYQWISNRVQVNKMKKDLIQITEKLKKKVNTLTFSGDVAAVYNPLDYAWEPHRKYLESFGGEKKKILFLGMNPGPWGMAQTGIPFGEITAAKEWLGMAGPVSKPTNEHPKRPVEGFDCPKSEVSGRRFWGLMKERYGTAEDFFKEHYVLNYCPLVFMGDTGRNLTPDKLPKAESAPLYEICDEHLKEVIEILDPEWLIGVGKFALKRFEAVDSTRKKDWIIHPSPANPHANRGWNPAVEKKMAELGLWN